MTLFASVIVALGGGIITSLAMYGWFWFAGQRWGCICDLECKRHMRRVGGGR